MNPFFSKNLASFEWPPSGAGGGGGGGSSVFTNVVDYGADPSGNNDSTSAINTAIQANPKGGVIFFPAGTYKTSSNIVVNISGITLLGTGDASQINLIAGTSVTITASHCQVHQLYIKGPGSSSFASNNDNAINAFGADSSHYITDLIIENVLMSDTLGYGIQCQFIDHFQFRGNRIHDVAYTGIGILSSQHGVVEENEVHDINLTAGQANSYGIFVSRNTGTNAAFPLSKQIDVVGNIVFNNPTWEGIDTHAGQDLTISGNVVVNCNRGIVVGPDNSTNAPNNVAVTGNTLDSAVTNGSAVYGIVVAGNAGGTYAEGCTVTGNSIIRYGDTTSATGGALYINATSGLTVTGNSFIESSPIAIFGTTPANVGVTITGNSFIDVWSTSVGRATAIQFVGNGHSGIVEANVFTTRTKVATFVLTEGVRFDGGATSINFSLGNNEFTGTTWAVNPPSTAFTGTSQVTLTAVGSTPNANAASLSAQALTLQPADGSNPGVVTTASQTFAGTKTFSSTISGNISGSSGSTTGNAATVTTNANLTGNVTSVGNATTIAASAIVNSMVSASAAIDGSKLVSASASVPGVVTTGTQTMAGVKTFSTQLIGAGTATNDSAASGIIGERISSSVTTFTNMTGATGAWGNLTSMSLTAGDWDVTGIIEQFSNTGVGITANSLAISVNSGGTITDQVQGDNQSSFARPDSISGQCSGNVPVYRLSLASPTTVFLKANTTYASGNPQYKCRLSARRMR